MNGLEFFIWLLALASFDVIAGFILFVGFQYFQRKYNSKLDISILEEENKYLKRENKKINGTSSNFWDKDDKRL